jgi:hypothetical protein
MFSGFFFSFNQKLIANEMIQFLRLSSSFMFSFVKELSGSGEVWLQIDICCLFALSWSRILFGTVKEATAGCLERKLRLGSNRCIGMAGSFPFFL